MRHKSATLAFVALGQLLDDSSHPGFLLLLSDATAMCLVDPFDETSNKLDRLQVQGVANLFPHSPPVTLVASMTFY